jgi:hypothetical protein
MLNLSAVLSLSIQAFGLFLAAAIIFNVPVRKSLIGASGVVLVCLLFASLILFFAQEHFGIDYRIFWNVGNDVWSGVDPYSLKRFAEHPFLHPPTALPVFACFALFPFNFSKALWTIANAVIFAGLAFLTQRTILEQERFSDKMTGRPNVWELPGFVLVGLTGTLAVSTACFANFVTGQLGVVVTLMILAALRSQARGQPFRAGLWLALATIKVTTLFPFLLLFTRRDDRLSWAGFMIGVLGLTLIATPPTRLPDRLRLLAGHVQELQAPGQVNDVSFDGTQHTTILGFEHAAFRLGFRDKKWIQTAQFILVLGLAVAVFSQLFPRATIPRAAACSLVAAFSTIFLYHRIYDAVILVIPLIYCVGWARATPSPARWLFRALALMIVLVLYLPSAGLRSLTERSLHTDGVDGWLIQALLLPYATWLILILMAGIAIGGRHLVRSAALRKNVA